jgi:hypothetical protein
MPQRIISADSHITEPGNTYVDHINAKFRDRAPHLEHADSGGDLFVIPGMKPSKRAVEPASASDIVALDETASRQPTNRPSTEWERRPYLKMSPTVEWHPGELYPPRRLHRHEPHCSAKRVVAF